MHQGLLVDQAKQVLHKAGFMTSKRCDVRSRCFDIAARRGAILLFIKMLSNIDGLNEETAFELKRLAEYFCGSPLLIGEKARNRALEEGAVYARYGIPAVNIDTLFDFFVNELPPLVYAAPGGLYVRLDEEALNEARVRKDLSLGAIASELGVSRRSIRKYEEGMDAKVEIALRLEAILDTPLAVPISLLTHQGLHGESAPNDSLPPLEQQAMTTLTDLGFKVFPMSQVPFDMLSQIRQDTLLTAISKSASTIIKRAELMSSISRVVSTHSLYITSEQPKRFKIFDTVVILLQELEDLDSPKELLDLVKERAEG
ncbi:MAG: transcriptional regulator [Halobacteriota archaeon]